MSAVEVLDAFTKDELQDVQDAADTRGMTIWEYIHDVVMGDALRGTWNNRRVA